MRGDLRRACVRSARMRSCVRSATTPQHMNIPPMQHTKGDQQMNLQGLPDNYPALPSPKCVVLFGDGFSSSLSSSHSHPNLDKLTADGCVGPLMLRNGGLHLFSFFHLPFFLTSPATMYIPLHQPSHFIYTSKQLLLGGH